MALEVITQIKAAEQEAEEIRRTAAAAAKDALKLAAKENAQIEDETLTQARRASLEKVDEAKAATKAELEKRQQQRLVECDKLKENARKQLDDAAAICIERLLS